MNTRKYPLSRITQADLKCKKTGCEFYGNATFDGYCSKCYRDAVKDAEQQAALHENSNASNTNFKFTKFQDKKRQQSDKRIKFNLLLRKSPGGRELGRNQRQDDTLFLNPHLFRSVLKFFKDKQLTDDMVKDFYRCVRAFYSELGHDDKSIDEVAASVQAYYTNFSNRLNNHALYSKVDPNIRNEILECYERFVTETNYELIFCPSTTSDEEKDLAIQHRIRKLSWVNAEHLDCCISETSIELRDLVYTAITELIGIDSVKAPREKLSCIVNCCKSVMEVLRNCQNRPVGADDFLPALIYIVLKANPARLKSNILYITRFANESRVMTGETGYYFTNLCCAVSFIENLTAESLNMSQEEFDGYMNGDIKAVSAWESALVACESLHQLNENLKVLGQLAQKVDVVKAKSAQMKIDVQAFQDEITSKVSEVLKSRPLTIYPPKDVLLYNTPAIKEKQNFYEKNLQSINVTLTPKFDLKTSDPTASTPEDPMQNPSSTHNDSSISNFSLLNIDESSFLNLSSINYDIDFSDLSGENSTADDLTPNKQQQNLELLLNDEASMCESIIDKKEITPDSKLPPPLEPTPHYSGFAAQGFQIPSIPCHTGHNTQTKQGDDS